MAMGQTLLTKTKTAGLVRAWSPASGARSFPSLASTRMAAALAALRGAESGAAAVAAPLRAAPRARKARAARADNCVAFGAGIGDSVRLESAVWQCRSDVVALRCAGAYDTGRHRSPTDMKRPFLNRRMFLTATVGGALAARAFAVDAEPWVAAVIGHTGRGDYGHGLDAIFQGRPGVRVVAVADPDGEGRARVAARIGAARSYADYREMLERERPRVVSIAMRHADQHHAVGLECLRAGAHCYFEKPFTRSPDESDALLAEAGSRGLRIAVAHTMRLMPQVRALHRAVEDGMLGELRELRAHGKQDARAGGEDMMVLGTHLFDLFRLFCGDPISVSARVTQGGRRIRPEDRRLVKDNVGWVAGDQVFAEFEFPAGVTGTFGSDGKLRETTGHWGIELVGSRGVARINCDIAPNVFVRTTTGWSAAGRQDVWKPLDPALMTDPPEHNLGPVGDWLEAIRRGREPACSGRNGAWAVEMVAGVYASALGGSRVAFPLGERRHPLGPA